MLTLNILPSEVKQEIKFKYVFNSTKLILYIFTFAVTVYSLVLYGCYFYLQGYYKDISQQTTIATKNTDNYSKQVKDINKQISYIEGIEKETVYWSFLMKDLFNNLPGDIKLTKVDYNKKNNSLSLAGVAGTRDGLISMRKYFENNRNLSLTSFPVQSLVQKEKINFDIILNISSYSPEAK